jgi:hypothetical protein
MSASLYGISLQYTKIRKGGLHVILLPHTCDFLNFTTLRSINALILIIYPSPLVSVLILLLYIYKTINLLEMDLLLYLNLVYSHV